MVNNGKQQRGRSSLARAIRHRQTDHEFNNLLNKMQQCYRQEYGHLTILLLTYSNLVGVWAPPLYPDLAPCLDRWLEQSSMAQMKTLPRPTYLPIEALGCQSGLVQIKNLLIRLVLSRLLGRSLPARSQSKNRDVRSQSKVQS